MSAAVTKAAAPANRQVYASVMTDEIELKALMLASQEGDAAADRVLLGRLSSRLRAYYKGKLARIGKAATEAEDLVQEAVLAIHLKRGTFDPGEPLTPWVYAIACYKLIDFLRRIRPMRERTGSMVCRRVIIQNSSKNHILPVRSGTTLN
jgi:DNA-directed RNA polymerase specialized sigma24 family protein